MISLDPLLKAKTIQEESKLAKSNIRIVSAGKYLYQKFMKLWHDCQSIRTIFLTEIQRAY